MKKEHTNQEVEDDELVGATVVQISSSSNIRSGIQVVGKYSPVDNWQPQDRQRIWPYSAAL
jgi:hypothetical protein